MASGGADHHVPRSWCLSATGVRFLVILSHWGSGPPLRTAYRHPQPQAPDPNGVSTFHTHEPRPGWAPSIPRGQRCSHDRLALPGRRLPHLNGNVPGPRSSIHHPRRDITRHHRRFTHVRPSGLPQPVALRWSRSPWAFPEASHPAVTSSARPGGDGHRALARNYTVDISRPPSCESTRNVRPRVARATSLCDHQEAPAAPSPAAAARQPSTGRRGFLGRLWLLSVGELHLMAEGFEPLDQPACLYVGLWRRW
jgi:hypothetical protein